MNAVLTVTLTVLVALTGRIRTGWENRGTDAGASTLELVILVLGLIAVATLLVATLTAAVKSRTDQIN
jgi:heme/copper-type cytochrome/quinol oxidase subunit 2